VTHDHEALQLAIASLDFELTPAERTRMEAGLAACPECAALAAGHVQVQGLLQQLPVHDASPHVRQRVMRATQVGQGGQWPIEGDVEQMPQVVLVIGGFRRKTHGGAVGAQRRAVVPEKTVGDTEDTPCPRVYLISQGVLCEPCREPRVLLEQHRR